MNAILLAGGKSKRFKSNKALAKYKGEALIKRIAKNLNKHFKNIYIVVDDKDKYTFLKEYQLVEDIIPNKGPIGGKNTELKYSNTKYNYLTAVDMPLITGQYLEIVKNWNQGYDALVPKYNRKIEPLAGVYSKSCLEILRKNLENNKLSVIKFIEEINSKKILIKDLLISKDIFCNVNYKSDLEKIKENDFGADKKV